MKKLLKSTPVVRTLIKVVNRTRWNFRAWRLDPCRNMRRVLRGYQNLTIVQIGSNDGKSDDPIHDLLIVNETWRAILVEPVPFLFERLKINYSNVKGVQFANVAIGETEGLTPFFFLDHLLCNSLPNLPPWFDQLGSFNEEHIVKHLGESIRPWIVRLEIPTVPLSKLFSNYGITHIDVLHIDTEGYDWKILSQLDFELFHPRVILFEYKHLSEIEKLSALTLLKKFYYVKDLSVGGDFLCTRMY
jgi:FkbM family methyltransferase